MDSNKNKFPSLKASPNSQVHVLYSSPVFPFACMEKCLDPPNTSSACQIKYINSCSNLKTDFFQIGNHKNYHWIQRWICWRTHFLLHTEMIIQEHFLEACHQTLISINYTNKIRLIMKNKATIQLSSCLFFLVLFWW